MKIRATKVTAFLTGIWTFIVMNASQWWLKAQADAGSMKDRFTTTFALLLLIAVPCFIFVFGILEPRPAYVVSREGMKSQGIKFLRMLCMLAGWGVTGLAWTLAIRPMGTHP